MLRKAPRLLVIDKEAQKKLYEDLGEAAYMYSFDYDYATELIRSWEASHAAKLDGVKVIFLGDDVEKVEG